MTINDLKIKFDALGIRTGPEHIRDLVANVRDSDKGWEVHFNGGPIRGRYAGRNATRATLGTNALTGRPFIRVACRKAHNWQRPTAAWALRDIGEQLDDLIDEIESGTQRDEDHWSYNAGLGV